MVVNDEEYKRICEIKDAYWLKWQEANREIKVLRAEVSCLRRIITGPTKECCGMIYGQQVTRCTKCGKVLG